MKASKTTDYKTLKAELDDVLDALQRDDTDVDAALAGYERGLELISQLEAYLQTAENKIKQLQANQA
ncbi:exodeoxyribonuclease VII small subunit [Polaromonas sp.]|nr:exodeoxyribonuclease VII small subunit [Candidatus Saccharibacteria bacterium]